MEAPTPTVVLEGGKRCLPSEPHPAGRAAGNGRPPKSHAWVAGAGAIGGQGQDSHIMSG